MSFNFGSNNINRFKAQAAYKDGGGMGGGGMYMQQGKKRKEAPDEDLFEFSNDDKVQAKPIRAKVISPKCERWNSALVMSMKLRSLWFLNMAEKKRFARNLFLKKTPMVQ